MKKVMEVVGMEIGLRRIDDDTFEISISDKRKSLAAWKVVSAINRALNGKSIKVAFGNEIVEIQPDEFLKAIKKNFFDIFDKDKLDEVITKLAYSESIFEHVLDSEDRLNSALKMRLTREEFSAVRDLLQYDADCEAWVLKCDVDETDVVKRLIQFERFRAFVLWAVVRGMSGLLWPWAIDALKYYYYYKDRIIDYTKEQEEEFEKLNFQRVESESNLAGFNIYSIEVARYGEYYVYRYTVVSPPDDYGEMYYLSKKPLDPARVDFSINIFMSMRRIYELFKDIEVVRQYQCRR